jgi:hypothetical protein
MAIVLEANYAKKLGLPNYSSHQYSVTIRTELTDLTQVEAESTRLYGLLQDAVDREIQKVGFMPDASTNGMKPSQNGGNGHPSNETANGSNGQGPQRNNEQWNCTEGQKGLILRVVSESNLNKDDVERMAFDLFGRGVKALDKMQASQLIEELLEKTGKKTNGRRPWSRQPART